MSHPDLTELELHLDPQLAVLEVLHAALGAAQLTLRVAHLHELDPLEPPPPEAPAIAQDLLELADLLRHRIDDYRDALVLDHGQPRPVDPF